ncbi:zinc finger protein OZF [Drosophila bipectinata]|uniref:zinc finger protein OZF n=1 Tax=Drosophila bipectinata TaxID=42026 RepID=UPI001C890E59|nr:zinc finger protein OZF [Drosophila bipectinata]
MDQLCRICGSNSVTLVGIFDKRQQCWFNGELEPSLADMIAVCANVQLHPGDSLPQNICMTCVLDAQTAYRFKLKCERSNEDFYLAITKQQETKEEADAEELFIVKKLELDNLPMDSQQEEPEVIISEEIWFKDEVPIKTQKTRKTAAKNKVLKTTEPILKNSKIDVSKLFKCDLCVNVFQRQRNLIDHMKIHTNSHCCKTCGERFLFKTDLDQHQCFKTNNSAVECPVCLKVFSTSRGLDMHKCQSTEEGPLKCPYCPQTFIQEQYLKAHLLIHPEQEPSPLIPRGRHQCTICSAVFTNKSALEVHINAHKGKRPHECSVCSASFRSKPALTLHIRTHTGEKPYQCPHCPKAFSDNNNLIKHRRRHTDIRPYQCLLCQMCFREKHHLKRHVLGKHRGSELQELECS